jgi:hypothetical protein
MRKYQTLQFMEPPGNHSMCSRNHSVYSRIFHSVFALTTLFLLLEGCTYQRTVSLPTPGLPESIFSAPEKNRYHHANVALFSFGEPAYAPGKGNSAARYLCQEMTRRNVFASVILQSDILNMTLENLIDAARSKGYDLLITGKLLYYFDGSHLEPSEVTEEIRVIRVRGGRPKTLWHARATETVMPELRKDYILARGKGAPAPPTAVLMKRNAEKFCNMLMVDHPIGAFSGLTTLEQP